MTAPTKEDFQNILNEQKKTNELLAIGNKDPELASSVKQNLGEILNESRLAKVSETFQQKEGITQVDEAQALTTEELNIMNLSLGDKLHLIFLQLSNVREITLEQLKLGLSSNQIEQKRLEEITKNKKTAAQLEEDEKKKGLSLKEMFKSISKTFSGFRSDVKNYRNKVFPAKGLFKTAIGAAGLLLGLDFLTGGDGERFFSFIDKMITTFKKIYSTRIKPLVIKAGDKLDKLITDMANDKLTYTEIFQKNSDTILIAIGVIFSRTIAAIGLAAGSFIISKGILGGVLSRIFYGKGGKKGVKGMGFLKRAKGIAGRAGIVGLIITALGGVFGAVSNAMKEESDPDKIKGGFFSVAIGTIVQDLFNFGTDITGFVIGLLLGKRAKEKFENKLKEKGLGEDDDTLVKASVSAIERIKFSLFGVGEELGLIDKAMEKVVNLFRGVRSFLQGIVLKFFDIDLESADEKIRAETKFRENIQKQQQELEKEKQKLIDRQKEREEFEASDEFQRFSDFRKKQNRNLFAKGNETALMRIRRREEALVRLQEEFLKRFPRYDLENRVYVDDKTLSDKENEMKRRIFETRTQEIEMMAERIQRKLEESGKELPPVNFLDSKSNNSFTNMTFEGRTISIQTQRGGICIAI